MSGGVCGGRGLRLLLLLVLALAGVEYMFGSYLETGTGSLRAYLYTQANHEPQTTHETRIDKSNPWPKRTQSRPTSFDESYADYETANASNLANSNSTGGSVEEPTGEAKTDRSEFALAGKGEKESATRKRLPPCPSNPPDLGPITVNKTELSLSDVEKRHCYVDLGGRHKPTECVALHKVAIVVPYRDRVQHLAIFLNNLHPVLMKQQLDYGIFIVEQKGNKAFNRAKLMNVGFVEAQKARRGGWDCFVFHDIDLLPLDSRNMYSCPKQPRHMSVAIDKYNFNLPYSDIFGGVSAMTVAHFKAVNGFSNKYWGWGGEDDDMNYRIKKMNLHVARYPMSIARYTMLKHTLQSPNPKRYQLLSQTNKVFHKDGLSSLEYQVVNITKRHLYTSVLANINEHS